MKKGIILTAMMASMLVYILPSCYKNKEDLLTASKKVSFRADVVPIMVAGGCGCHNNGTTRAIQFSHGDTIFYGAILGRVGLFNAWVNGGTHPGEGEIYFKPSEENIIKMWIAAGAKDDEGGCTVTGNITHTANIQPIYISSCKGSTCHGGIAANFDFAAMVSHKTALTNMMNSGGGTGHPGGVISISSCTAKTFLEWITQGLPR